MHGVGSSRANDGQCKKKKSACMQQCPNDRRDALSTRFSCSCRRQSVHAETLGEAKKLIQAFLYCSSLAARDFFSQRRFCLCS